MAAEFVPAEKFEPEPVTVKRVGRIGGGIWLVYLGCAGLWAGSYLHSLGAILYSMLAVVGSVALVLFGTALIAWHQRKHRSEAAKGADAERKRRLDMMNKWSR